MHTMPRSNKNLGHDEYEVIVARTVDEVEALREVWQGMQPASPNADVDFYLTILKCRSEIVRPHVMMFKGDGIPLAMVIGRMEERGVKCKIAYKTLCEPKARILVIVHGGILGEQSLAKIIVDRLVDALRQDEADVIILESLRSDSDVYQEARSIPTFLCRDHALVRNTHWNMTLPATLDELFRKISPNRREELRRFPRLLEKAYPGGLFFECFKDKEHVDRLCKDVEVIAKSTYQRGLGVGFIDNTENRQRLRLEAEKGWLRGYVLYVKGEPCAFWIGTLYKTTFHVAFLGFDPRFRRYKPGIVVFSKMIEDLYKDNVTEIDFGFGDALYKQRFGDQKWEEVSLYIFASTWKGIGINLLRTLTFSASRVAQAVVKYTRLEEKIKRYWRNRVRTKSSGEG